MIDMMKKKESVMVEFSEEYEVVPIVTVTPIGLPDFFHGIDEITTRGFKILISETQEKEVVFNWHSKKGSDHNDKKR